MILKKLEIQGFKSFADRTEVLFTNGVTAVVGPNGSGKSNISDAILWVLGEQNVRAIRGQKAQDVIFAGTDKRRATGMAEVSLTIDNTSGKLPLEYSEVTVTRRAYRSGESEFFINKVPCRLKDIYELFLDTGVGREAYSIISQGEMDAILSARPEDRRTLFDEAAGIKKYRHRKKEAERKLDNVETNLNRVNDIVSELQTQTEPMAEQAELAKRYLELSSRLQEIEVGILVNDLHRFTADLERVRVEKESDLQDIADSDAVLSALEEEKSALAVDLANADSQVERYGATHQEALTHAERTESQLALVKQRHASAIGAEERLSEEIAQIRARIDQLESQRDGLSSEHEQAEAQEAGLNASLEEKTASLQAIHQKMDFISRSADDQKSTYIELAKQLAAQRNELANTTARIENLQALLNRRSQELRDAETASTKADTELKSAQESLEKIRVELASVTEAMGGVRKQLETKLTDIRETTQRLDRLNREIVDKQSRLKTLQEMEDAKEGYFFGVRSVAAAVKSGQLKGEYAVVADVIKVPRGYETAYEVALGASLQDIITESEQDAKAGIEFLKRTKTGRATFLPLNMMRHNASPGLKDLIGKNGVLGLGSEIIKFDKRYAPAIDSLLARVLICDTIDSAIAASRKAMGWSKIVTLDGELVFPSGAMTGGHAPSKTVNILGRKQEIESLEVEVRSLVKESDTLHKTRTGLQGEADTLSTRLSALDEQDTRLKMSLLEKERQLEFTGREAKRLANELQSVLSDKESLQDNLKKAREAQTKLSEAIENAEKENTDLDGLMSQTDQQVRELQTEYDALSAQINSITVTLASLTQKKIGMEQTLENSNSTARELSLEASRKQSQLQGAANEEASTEKQRAELGTVLERARKACEDTHAESEQWRKTKQSILASSMEVNERVREVSKRREELTQKVHAGELREARLDMQISQSTARLLEEYDLSVEAAMAMEQSEVKYGSTAEVLRLRREIKSMGEVNTGAVGEYTRLTERLEFLSTQRQDLLDAKQDLVKAIREIDESTRGVFMETFQAVGHAFQIMFQRLFDGGGTELVLTNPEDILETGIDVIVEMPGKKRQNLHLLSGGERALTAAALMFALMFVRPSPFCVMDEVDAPLDEANVERFADVVKEFAERSQIIIITHNKSTMEAADVLYGVTMQEPGVSTLVSVQLSDVSERN